jgi:hypothetical protein
MRDRQGPGSEQTILVNRAPVLTLWASVVAERLGAIAVRKPSHWGKPQPGYTLS